jgi:hypothetical protein
MRIIGLSGVYVVAGLALGLASAVYSFDNLGLRSVANQNGWQEWRLAASDRFEPYAVGHFLSAGRVPTPSSAKFFVRSVDDDGNSLRGDCVFTVEGATVRSRWWSLSVESDGDSYTPSTLSAGKAFLEEDGRLIATVSHDPSPGNWIRPRTTGRFQIIYTISDAAPGEVFDLPRVKKSGC